MVDAALLHYGRAVELTPFNVHYRMMLAYLYWTTGDLENARVHVETCIQQEPVFFAGRHVLKEILESQGRHSEAEIVAQELGGIKENYKGYVPRSRYEGWLLMEPSVYVEKFLKRA